MSRAVKLLRNIAANWLGFAVNAAVTLLLTPFVLHTLGEARYGVWVISSSIVGYYGLLDLGFRGSINQHLTRYLAIPDYNRASGTLSTAVVALSTLGVGLAFLSIGAAYAAPMLWNFPPGMDSEAFWCVLVVGLTAAVQFVFFPFTAVFVATQRFDLSNAIGISSRLLTALCVYLALSSGLGLIGISVATCAVTLLDYLVRWRVALGLAPELRVERTRASRAQLRELAGFGFWTFLMAINSYVYLHAQPLLIGALLPVAAVGHYALATGLAQQLNGALSPIGQVIYPAAAALHSRSDRATLERLYHDGTRLMSLVMVCAVAIAWFWAEDFYRLWIGPKYVAGDSPLPSVALLLQILLGATVSGFFSNIAAQTLMGTGKVRTVALLLIVGSALNLGFTLALIGPLGLVGPAIATVIASIAIDAIAMPLALQRVTGLRAAAMLRNAMPRPIVVALLLVPTCYALRELGAATSWPQLVMQGALAGIVALAVVLAVGVTAEERDRFVYRWLRRAAAARSVSAAAKD